MKKPSVNPNDGFMEELNKFYSELQTSKKISDNQIMLLKQIIYYLADFYKPSEVNEKSDIIKLLEENFPDEKEFNPAVFKFPLEKKFNK